MIMSQENGFTVEDLPVGTVLVFREHTDSYKYFRILNVYRSPITFGSIIDLNDTFWVPGYAENGERMPLEKFTFKLEGEFVTDFEMAKSINGPWDKSERVCEIKNWHINCDIFYTVIQEKISRLTDVE